MAIAYTVAIDRDDDGSFAGSGEDLTADVLALRWQLGMAQAHDCLAEPGWAQITVRNFDQRYSPEVTSLQPGQVLRITADDGSTMHTLFTGHLTHIEPEPGDQGQRTAVLHAVDAGWQLRRHTLRLPPQIGVRADAVIEQILNRVPFRRTRMKGYWLLGKPDFGELGTATRPPIAPIPMTLESGQTVFAFIGDTWGDGVLASEAIRQVVETERGRFFIDREGQAVFLNRHHLLKATTSAALVADNMTAVDYQYGAETISRVQVRLLPRSQGPAGTVLWQLETAQIIPADSDPPVQIVARFRDDQQRPIGALTLVPPVPLLDYAGRAKADGSGANLTSSLDVTLRHVDFSAALLEIRNRSHADIFLQPGARLRGTPIYTGDPLFIEQVSHGSLALYSPQTLLFDLPALDSVAQADSLARYELARRRTPRGQVRILTLSTRQHAAAILERSLYDRVTVEEAQTGHHADYFIIAEAHGVDRGGSRHHTTWTLERADATLFWVLGQMRLNQDTVLAY